MEFERWKRRSWTRKKRRKKKKKKKKKRKDKKRKCPLWTTINGTIQKKARTAEANRKRVKRGWIGNISLEKMKLRKEIIDRKDQILIEPWFKAKVDDRWITNPRKQTSFARFGLFIDNCLKTCSHPKLDPVEAPLSWVSFESSRRGEVIEKS